MGLHWSTFESGITFEHLHDGKRLPVSEWENTTLEHGYAQWCLIQELLDNAQAECAPDSVFIPHEEICQLNSIDHRLLELPTPFQGDIRIDADGQLGRPGFELKWGFYVHHQGERLPLQLVGCVLTENNQPKYLISATQYSLCKALKKFQQRPDDQTSSHQDWVYFSEIKALAQEAGAHLDSYLQNENVITPDSLKLKLSLEGQEILGIQPEIDFEESHEFENRFDRFPRIQSHYTVSQQNGERLRIAFTPQQQEELQKIKTFRKVTGEKKQQILEHPELFFDPDIIDLDLFSDRVLDIGLYKPKFYPFISPYQSQWIPGFLVETSAEERHKLTFETPAILKSFQQAIDKSVAAQKSEVDWQKFKIPVSEAKNILAVAQKQWSQPEIPLKVKDEQGKKVLIIKENIEELEHQAQQDIEEPEFIHRYTAPPCLRAEYSILEHQQEGIAWLQSLYLDQYSGALLADDMGLGKTLQGLSFIQWHQSTCNDQQLPYLLVAPVSLLENWEAEYHKFFANTGLEVLKAYGKTLSDILGGTDWKGGVATLQHNYLILTTYETLRRNQLIFCAVDWAVVILDEAQKIKNPGTLITNAAKALKADFRIAVTGTPVENTLLDLWCIMDFAVPGLLGSAKNFAQNYQNPLKSEDTDVAALGEQLRKQIGIHIKRRVKEHIAHELPDKYIQKRERLMPAVQLEKYLQVIQSKDDQADRKHMLQVLFNLRDVCSHPYLLEDNLEQVPMADLLQSSAKYAETYEILKNIDSKSEKVIIFAERRETQLLLARMLQENFGVHPSIINGSTPATAQAANSARLSRQQAVDRFQSTPGFNAIVISQLAAGVGLNITGANHVIHYSRHWNPAKEDQATDRAYRIGQNKDVYVYLPQAIAPDFKSFDLILDELLERKRQLANASLFPTDQAEVKPDDLYHQLNQSLGRMA